MAKENLKNIHLGYLIIPLILSVIGIIFIYSTGILPSGGNTNQFVKQLIWMILGIGLASVVIFVDYHQFIDNAEILYIIGVFLLIVTLIFGKTVRGARSWLGFGGLGIQPSEIMKLFTILMTAKFLSQVSAREKFTRTFLIATIIIGIPLVFVLLQPDLGTSLVYIFIFLCLSFFGLPNDRFLFYMIITGGLTALMILGNAYYRYYYLELIGQPIEILNILLSFNTMITISIAMFLYTLVALILEFFNPKPIIRKILPITIIFGIAFLISALSMVILKQYQWKRLLVFLNPEFDRWGAGYNIIQSKIAIGSGGFWGKGIFRGTQNTLGFLPEKSTDFIFSIISEETGFFGSAIVIILFSIYFYYIIQVILTARDKEGMLLGVGIFAMFVIHFLINIGMTLGIAPVTGLPLPFVSYGGSAYLTFILSAGLLVNIHANRFIH